MVPTAEADLGILVAHFLNDNVRKSHFRQGRRASGPIQHVVGLPGAADDERVPEDALTPQPDNEAFHTPGINVLVEADLIQADHFQTGELGFDVQRSRLTARREVLRLRSARVAPRTASGPPRSYAIPGTSGRSARAFSIASLGYA